MDTEQMNNKKEALKGVLDLAKQQITLATGAVVFSGTILNILLGPKKIIELQSGWLFISWGLLIVSIIFGLFVNGRYVTQLSASQYEITDKWLSWLSRIQQISFLLGILIFVIFAALSWT